MNGEVDLAAAIGFLSRIRKRCLESGELEAAHHVRRAIRSLSRARRTLPRVGAVGEESPLTEERVSAADGDYGKTSNPPASPRKAKRALRRQRRVEDDPGGT